MLVDHRLMRTRDVAAEATREPTRMTLLKRMPLIAAVLAGAIAATPSHASGPALTVAAYHSKANAICIQEQRQTMKLVMGARSLAVYLTAEIPVLRTAHGDLERLHPPASLASLHAQIVATVGGEVARFSSLAVKAKAGKLTIAQFEKDPQRVALTSRELAIWKRIGAKSCSGP